MTPLQTPAAVVAELERLEAVATDDPTNGGKWKAYVSDLVRNAHTLLADAKRARELVAVVEAQMQLDVPGQGYVCRTPSGWAYYRKAAVGGGYQDGFASAVEAMEALADLDAAKDKEDGK